MQMSERYFMMKHTWDLHGKKKQKHLFEHDNAEKLLQHTSETRGRKGTFLRLHRNVHFRKDRVFKTNRAEDNKRTPLPECSGNLQTHKVHFLWTEM